MARTSNRCGPSGSPVYPLGDEQGSKPPPSRLHSKTDADSLDEKLNSASGDAVGPDGPEPIAVSGGVVSSDGTVCGPVVGPGVTMDDPDQNSGSIRSVRGCV
jgi:hypothetical protein